jgi:PilZ domain
MWYNSDLGESPETSNHRKHGRVKCQGIYCSFGEILDMSGSGMRVLSAIRPPAVDKIVTVTIQTLEGPIAVEARVIWSRRAGFFKREIGMRFVDLLPSAASALSRVGSAAAHNESVRQDVEKFRRSS